MDEALSIVAPVLFKIESIDVRTMNPMLKGLQMINPFSLDRVGISDCTERGPLERGRESGKAFTCHSHSSSHNRRFLLHTTFSAVSTIGTNHASWPHLVRVASPGFKISGPCIFLLFCSTPASLSLSSSSEASRTLRSARESARSQSRRVVLCSSLVDAAEPPTCIVMISRRKLQGTLHYHSGRGMRDVGHASVCSMQQTTCVLDIEPESVHNVTVIPRSAFLPNSRSPHTHTSSIYNKAVDSTLSTHPPRVSHGTP